MAGHGRRTFAEMAAILRTRICLADPGADLVLHEGKIAEEFEVSRTPVRQVLQRLAYERLVETRSGIGTIAMQLRDGEEARDSLVFSALMKAGALCASGPIPEESRMLFAALNAATRSTDRPSVERFFELRARLLDVMAPLFDDPILYDAHQAAHWRLIRWRVQAFRKTPEQAWHIFIGSLRGSESLLDGRHDASDVLNWISLRAMKLHEADGPPDASDRMVVDFS